jgi:HK97 family phage portal protein
MSMLFRSRPAVEKRMTIDALGDLARSSFASYGSFVTEESAMRHDAVWSCRTRIAQDVSMMPVDVVRYDSSKKRSEVNPVPQIIAAPSAWTAAIDWRYQIVDSWLANGNAYGWVTETTGDGRYPTRIELLEASTVIPKPGQMGTFTVAGRGESTIWPLGNLWHVPAFTVAGQLLGLSPIQYHRVTISLGLGAEQFGKSFFDADGHPLGIIAPGSDPGPEGAQSLKDKFMAAVNGSSREPIVLPKDTTWTPLQVDPTDSQFIETQRYTVEQICRIFGEDPADHGASAGGDSITYANRSDADLARLKRRQFWVTKLQLALSDLVPSPNVVKLNTSSSLMMTSTERHTLHKLRLNSKTRTINEVRVIEDEAEFDGDEFNEPGIPGTPIADTIVDD